MRRCNTTCAMLVLFGLAAPVHGQDVIGWKFTEGDTFYLLADNNVKLAVRLAGQPLRTITRTTTVYAVRVKKKHKDGSADLVLKMESVHVSGEGQMASASKALEQLEGGSFQVTVGPDGRVGRVEHFQDLVKKLTTKTGLPISSGITEETLKSTAETFFAGAPGKALKVDDSWENKTSLPVLGQFGDLDATEVFTFRGTEDGVARITSEVAVTYKLPLSGGLAKVTQGDFKANKADAVYRFDAAAGLLNRLETNLKLQGTMTAEVAGQTQQIGLAIDATLKVRRLASPPVK
jgi:hypothetical protein